MNDNVFINCPFDDEYEVLFDAILFSIYFCGFKPRCAMEIDDGLQNRLEKICNIIKECDLGIHDISRTELNSNDLPRFNMPFELGIFFGAKLYGGIKQKKKACMIFDVQRYRYQQYLSDISGQDIKAHKNSPESIITNNRNWLNSFCEGRKLPGAKAIIEKYHLFLERKPSYLDKLHLTPEDLTYSDKVQLIEEWIGMHQIQVPNTID